MTGFYESILIIRSVVGLFRFVFLLIVVGTLDRIETLPVFALAWLVILMNVHVLITEWLCWKAQKEIIKEANKDGD